MSQCCASNRSLIIQCWKRNQYTQHEGRDWRKTKLHLLCVKKEKATVEAELRVLQRWPRSLVDALQRDMVIWQLILISRIGSAERIGVQSWAREWAKPCLFLAVTCDGNSSSSWLDWMWTTQSAWFTTAWTSIVETPWHSHTGAQPSGQPTAGNNGYSVSRVFKVYAGKDLLVYWCLGLKTSMTDQSRLHRGRCDVGMKWFQWSEIAY